MTHPQLEGFLAAPPTGKGPGVLVLHAWWGLNDTMKAEYLDDTFPEVPLKPADP
jgi:hypothetical protein